MTSTEESNSSWGNWNVEQRRKLARSIWRQLRRPAQTPPADPWSTWYVRGGRGSGKTRTGAEALADDIIDTIEDGDTGVQGDWAVVAPTFGDARDTCVEGPSGLQTALAGYTEKWNRSMGQLLLSNGATVFADGADDGALRIQGKNLRGAWCDEIGLWRISTRDNLRLDEDRFEVKAWDESIMFAVRLDPGHIYVTGTPKRGHVLVKRLLQDETVYKTHMTMRDNIVNLSPVIVERLLNKYADTALGEQELEGKFLEDVEGALWVKAQIDASRLSQAGRMARIVVGVDPPGGATECGIVAAGLTAGPCLCGRTENLPHAYVLADRSLFPSGPNNWATQTLQTFHDLNADRIYGEVNYGGDMVVSTILNIDHNAPVEKVRASRGKIPRAEPVASLYGDPARPETWSRSRVHHVGLFPELEDEMTSYTPQSAGSWSPNRLDACLVGETPILTRRGSVSLETVQVGDEVWTRQGWKPVEAHRLTKTAPTMVVELSDGGQIQGTFDHQVWTANGWTRLDALVCGDILSGWNGSHIGVSSTVATPSRNGVQAVSTMRPRGAHPTGPFFTETSTSTRSVRYLTDTISTTSTATLSTMIQPTWLRYPQRNIQESIPATLTGKAQNGWRTLKTYGRWLLNGTVPMRDGNGIGSMDGKFGRTGRRAVGLVNSAAKRWSSGWKGNGSVRVDVSENGRTVKDVTYETPPVRYVGSRSNSDMGNLQPVPVSVVRSYVSDVRPVYDIQVADVHEFVAAGVIVHNCVWALTALGLSEWRQATVSTASRMARI